MRHWRKRLQRKQWAHCVRAAPSGGAVGSRCLANHSCALLRIRHRRHRRYRPSYSLGRLSSRAGPTRMLVAVEGGRSAFHGLRLLPGAIGLSPAQRAIMARLLTEYPGPSSSHLNGAGLIHDAKNDNNRSPTLSFRIRRLRWPTSPWPLARYSLLVKSVCSRDVRKPDRSGTAPSRRQIGMLVRNRVHN